MKIILLILLLWLFIPGENFAYDAERAKANLASDYVGCSVFYAHSAEALSRNDEAKYDKLIGQMKQLSESNLFFALKLSNKEVTEARTILEMKDQNNLIKNDFSNFSILILKYGELCKKLTENPEKRLQYWLDKK